MASVWKAHDERLGRTVAVKVLSETLALDRDFVERFRREAKVAAGLSHPNLVTVFDFEADGPRPYLVSEYVEGGTLADRLDSGGGVDAETLARQLLEALAHIHQAGVIHRDVKPANVLIDRDGRSRLTDFGIAQPRDATQMTDPGKVIGTLAYMAPEVQAGGKATERSDLYAAGVLLAEVLPPEGAGGLQSLAGRLSAADPSSRPASAQAALRMLDSHSAETVPLGAAALPPTERRPVVERDPTTRLLRPGPRRRVAALALGALIALAAGLALATSLGGNDAGGIGAGTTAKQPTTDSLAGKSASSAQTPAATQTPPATQAAPAGGQPQSASDSCQTLEGRQQALAGEPGPKGGQDKALKDQQKALREQLKSCGKAAESGGKKGD